MPRNYHINDFALGVVRAVGCAFPVSAGVFYGGCVMKRCMSHELSDSSIRCSVSFRREAMTGVQEFVLHELVLHLGSVSTNRVRALCSCVRPRFAVSLGGMIRNHEGPRLVAHGEQQHGAEANVWGRVVGGVSWRVVQSFQDKRPTWRRRASSPSC